jgi:hypothetical protein
MWMARTMKASRKGGRTMCEQLPPVPADERLDNPVGYYRYGDAPETTPRPLKLHSHGVELGNSGGVVAALGGPPFSRDFAAYLPEVPTAVERAEFARTHWWANPYWRRRVRAQFEQRFGAEQGKLRYNVALRLASGYQDTETLKRVLKRTTHWIHHQREIAERYATTALTKAIATTLTTKITRTGETIGVVAFA